MGMYDSVIAKCAQCGHEVEFQSKSGECRLHTFPASAVPVAVATGCIGDIEKCPDCGHLNKIDLPGIGMAVSMVVS